MPQQGDIYHNYDVQFPQDKYFFLQVDKSCMKSGIKYFRYLETAALVYSWYLTDVWEKESLSSVMIRRVNAMHRFYFPHLFVFTNKYS